MSCFVPPDRKELLAMNKKIEQEIRSDKHTLRAELKLLLLGPGESGKSTVVKQMKIIHGEGYTEAERKTFVPLINQNILTAVDNMLNAMAALEIPFGNPSLEKVASEFQEQLESFEALPFAFIKRLWQDEGIQAAYKRRHEYQLADSTKYFLDELDRISKPDYLPTEQDVLRARVPTTGIIEYTFAMKRVTFRMVDVGGQRSQRRKWIHCFEDVTSIVFIVGLSEYDQTLAESPTTNRMTEALTLFRHICREKWFKDTSVILFLNKTDLLAEKLPQSNVTKYFPDYKDDPLNMKKVQGYFLSLFEAEKSHIYPHFTCATNSDNIKHVFESVEDTLIREHLADYNLA